MRHRGHWQTGPGNSSLKLVRSYWAQLYGSEHHHVMIQAFYDLIPKNQHSLTSSRHLIQVNIHALTVYHSLACSETVSSGCTDTDRSSSPLEAYINKCIIFRGMVACSIMPLESPEVWVTKVFKFGISQQFTATWKVVDEITFHEKNR